MTVIPFAFVEKSPNCGVIMESAVDHRVPTSGSNFQTNFPSSFLRLEPPVSLCRTPWTVLFSPDHDTIQHHSDVLQTANAMFPACTCCGAGPQPVWHMTFSRSSLLGEGVCGMLYCCLKEAPLRCFRSLNLPVAHTYSVRITGKCRRWVSFNQSM